MATTSHLSVTLVEQSQAQKEVTLNQAITRIDAVLNTGAKSRNVSTPPGSPLAGDVYIVGSSPTGAWAGQAGNITYFDQTWKFITPREGMTLWVNDEDVIYSYTGSSWFSSAVVNFSTQSGTTYTLDGSELRKTLMFTNAGAITLTLPNSLYTSFNFRVIQAGTGQITFTPASGAFRRNRQSHTKTAGQYAVCDVQIIANAGGSAAEYLLSGDTAL